MAENAPPAAAASSGDSSRGMPYYEKLRRDLRETLQRKRALDASIVRTPDPTAFD
jgi:chromatin modification-related protein EAF6